MATQYTASYGLSVSSISSASAGAVTGTSYALPQATPSVISWTVVADGSALSVNLEGSNDDSVYSTLDSQTTATGGTRNFGPTSVKFIRISQVSRTGGTLTTATLITSKSSAFISIGSSSLALVADGTAGAPSIAFTSQPALGIYKSGSGSLSIVPANTSAAVNFINAAIMPASDNVVDLGVSPTNRFRNLNISGGMTTTSTGRFGDGTAAVPSIAFNSAPNTGMYIVSGTVWGLSSSGVGVADINGTGIQLRNDMFVGWSSGALNAANDVILARDAANSLAQRNGTSAQNFAIYNTFTDTSNYERTALGYFGNTFFIRMDKLGTGASRSMRLAGNAIASSILFNAGAGDLWRINGVTSGFEASTDNANDIGASGANRPRNIYAGTSFLAPDGSAATPSLSFASQTNQGFYKSATGTTSYSSSGNTQFLFGNAVFRAISSGVIGWSSGNPDSLQEDVSLARGGAGQLNIGGAAGANPYTINGTLTTNTTSASTPASTVETDLWSYSLPANALNANGRGVRITAFGTFAANTNLKSVRVYFGASVLVLHGALAFNNQTWRVVGEVIRTGASAQVGNAVATSTLGFSQSLTTLSIAENTAGAITIKMSGQNGTASAGDVTFLGAIVEAIK